MISIGIFISSFFYSSFYFKSKDCDKYDRYTNLLFFIKIFFQKGGMYICKFCEKKYVCALTISCIHINSNFFFVIFILFYFCTTSYFKNICLEARTHIKVVFSSITYNFYSAFSGYIFLHLIK